MPWAPGQSGNPAGYHGSRRWRHREVFEEIKKLGYTDALITLARIQHESTDDSLRVAAAAALAPYSHPKLQALPTPRFIENPIEVPEFTHVSDAEAFLAQIATLVARGELDFQSGLELSTLTKNWIDSQYTREELTIKQINAGGSEHKQVIKIEGGLPALPGTNVTMPMLNGHNGHALDGHALAAPDPAATESAPQATEPSTNDQDGNMTP
jgi:hypothetical protein